MPLVRRALPVLLVALLAGTAPACGGGGDGTTTAADHGATGHGQAGSGAGVDRAFAAAMIPHHESAIEMAKIARDRARSDFVRRLAADIVAAQQSEIETLERIDARLEEHGTEAGDLGVPSHMQGMNDDPVQLRDAEPFDRAFVDMMIPHHQGAVAMARAQLARGEDPELARLAQAIVDAQRREIDAMNRFRRARFGSESPAKTDDAPTGSTPGHNQAHATPAE